MTPEDELKLLRRVVSACGQAIILSNTTDPDNPKLDPELFWAAYRAICEHDAACPEPEID